MYFITGLSKAFEPFACTETESGSSYLNADPSIPCWEDEHYAILALDTIPLLIYFIGVPVVYSTILFRMCASGRCTARRLAVPCRTPHTLALRASQDPQEGLRESAPE